MAKFHAVASIFFSARPTGFPISDPREHLLPPKQSLIGWWAKKIMKLFCTCLQISKLYAAISNTICKCADKQLQVWIDLIATATAFPSYFRNTK